MKFIRHIEAPEYSFADVPVFNSDYHRMRRTWELFGTLSDQNNFNLAASIFTTKFVSGGANERRSHAKLYPYREALHAEQVALMSAKTSVINSTVYVCRMQNHNTEDYFLSLPCFWCIHTLIKHGVNKVVYTTGNKKPGKELNAFKLSSVKIDPISSLDIDYEMIP